MDITRNEKEQGAFFSEENQKHLLNAIQQLKEGKGVSHELLDEDEKKGTEKY